MVYHGHVKNGEIVIEPPTRLPEGAEVRIDVVESSKQRSEGEMLPTVFEQLQPLIASAEGLPADYAKNLDHYLYGAPKRP